MLFSTKVSDCTSSVAHEYFSFYHFKHDNFTELPYEMACKHLTKIIFVNVVFFIINMLQMKIKSMYFVLCTFILATVQFKVSESAIARSHRV